MSSKATLNSDAFIIYYVTMWAYFYTKKRAPQKPLFRLILLLYATMNLNATQVQKLIISKLANLSALNYLL